MSSFSAGDDEPSAAEWIVVAVSVVVTLSLFGYVAWHAATTPDHARPEASIVGTQTVDDGRSVVTVELYNPGSTGLESVTVSVDCSSESITFQHVPTDARLSGTFVCPAVADDPSVSIQTWVTSQGSRKN